MPHSRPVLKAVNKDTLQTTVRNVFHKINPSDKTCNDKTATMDVSARPGFGLYLREEPTHPSSLLKSTTTTMLCGLYALVLIVLGLILPIGVSLSFVVGTGTPYETEIFNLYIYTLSLSFLLYLHFYILRLKRRTPGGAGSGLEAGGVQAVSNNKLGDDTTPEKAACSYGDNIDTVSIESKDNKPRMTVTGSEIDETVDPVTEQGSGVNFYLRLGALGFGIGSMIHDGFKIAAVMEWPEDWLDCFGPLPLLNAILHLLFVFVQTFLIFKSHKMSINIHKAVVRFGLMHMVATNLCVWAAVTVQETAQQLREHAEHGESSEHKRSADPHSNNTHGSHDDERSDYEKCYREDSLVHTSAPYLFPCTIEYSLICAAIIYKMFQSVGKAQRHQVLSEDGTTVTSSSHSEDDGESSENSDCHKANTGLFLGLFIMVMTMIAVASFFVFTDRQHDYKTAAYLFFLTEIVLAAVAAVTVIAGFFRMRHLKFTALEEGWVDVALLVVALFGTFAHTAFTILSSANSIGDMGTVAILSLTASALLFVQAGMQTAFILDGLRRRADTTDHQQHKPGRTIITFLLVVNLSLWVVATFEVKKADATPMHQSYYGSLSWSIISHICQPLVIFFRFHSSVCLSDMWLHAYHKEKGA